MNKSNVAASPPSFETQRKSAAPQDERKDVFTPEQSRGVAESEDPDKRRLEIIQRVLEELRPAIMNHEGNIELIKYEENIVYVKLHGACVQCPISMFTLKLGVEEALKAELPEVKEVVAID